MTDSIHDLETDIEASRARLDSTIDQIQSRLSVSGIVDEMIGTTRRATPLGTVFDDALASLRRNPMPALLIAAGVGLLLHRVSKEAEARRALAVDAEAAERVRVLNTGTVRVYDPDTPTLHPDPDPLEAVPVPGPAAGARA